MKGQPHSKQRTRLAMATLSHLPLALLILAACCVLALASGGGQWKLLKRSIGISAMHMALLPNNRVIMFDRTDFGPSNVSLPNGRCRKDRHDRALQTDCWAHSVELNWVTHGVRPLTILTDTWCSSGALAPDGHLIQTGGSNDGERVVRTFSPCATCDWAELPDGLAMPRWYASNQILPDGRIIVVGGRGQFNYEFVPKTDPSEHSMYPLEFLSETRDDCENNLYPFLHLLPDGTLFLFANTKAISLDYITHRVVRTFPALPGESRNYPSTGSSTMLPLILAVNSTQPVDAEVLVCGGAPSHSNFQANKGVFLPASRTCGRIKATDESPEWSIETMPLKRVMGDMVMLPTGEILIINGAGKGTAGWGVGRDPVLCPVLYKPDAPIGHRFEVLSPSSTPRLYHSSAQLLSDGRVLVGGSNPNRGYNFSGVLFPTELSLEFFSPPYIKLKWSRPKITSLKPGRTMSYTQHFYINFYSRKQSTKGVDEILVTMVAPSFTTHSVSMNQRLLVLRVMGLEGGHDGAYRVECVPPVSAVLAPPGYYLLFLVHGGSPSRGVWVRLGKD
ncbi:aldehyde oxidase GLOX [Amborella trichopoda]|uniref:Galactose oxidase-like Early set domain-containing protein n=1 Tax=Amborella trichopoda TaxID=13333 RepID=W1PST2_AMBTC|nr:aldehyde oxidase GLOX [Amborella trichopoda]ERN10751.1 hypothetical protein AMTR_s00027p00175370 [Amborella trichopoda]|eukprot:XP_006849170.3 aldehyde oxidase GLOX [Amborella trichopoda]